LNLPHILSTLTLTKAWITN